MNSPVQKPSFGEYRAKDVALYETWAADPTKKNMGVLVNHLSPLIYQEVNRTAGTLPNSALASEAKIWAAKAVKTFDPSKGFALSTHVANYLQKVRRMNYKYQHTARIPENIKLEYGGYDRVVKNLTDELNREPTDDEIAKSLGWSKGKVVKLKNYIYADHVESADERPAEYAQFSDEDWILSAIINELSPEEKFLLDNKGKLSSPQLAEKLGVNTNRLNYLQKKLVNKLQDLKSKMS